MELIPVIFFLTAGVPLPSITDSERLGIVIIHQELALVPIYLSVRICFLAMTATSRDNQLEPDIPKSRRIYGYGRLKEDPRTLIKNIGLGKQQLIEIAKALARMCVAHPG